jgi:hypothetical protein
MASAGTRHAVTLWFYDSRERAAAVAAGTVDGGSGGTHTPALLSAAAGAADTAADDSQARAFIQVTSNPHPPYLKHHPGNSVCTARPAINTTATRALQGITARFANGR